MRALPEILGLFGLREMEKVDGIRIHKTEACGGTPGAGKAADYRRIGRLRWLSFGITTNDMTSVFGIFCASVLATTAGFGAFFLAG